MQVLILVAVAVASNLLFLSHDANVPAIIIVVVVIVVVVFIVAAVVNLVVL